MKLVIDGNEIIAQPGQTLLDLIRELHLDNVLLSERPIAFRRKLLIRPLTDSPCDFA